MKRGLYLVTFVLLAIAVSCTEEHASVSSYNEYVAKKPTPITFQVYQGDAVTTRAGQPGAITTDTDLQGKGFGVFAYHTETTTYGNVPVATRSLIPDFMYNEHIVWKAASSQWTYNTPEDTKYWPNDFSQGAVDSRATEAAQGSKVNYISFFAYINPCKSIQHPLNSEKVSAFEQNICKCNKYSSFKSLN